MQGVTQKSPPNSLLRASASARATVFSQRGKNVQPTWLSQDQ